MTRQAPESRRGRWARVGRSATLVLVALSLALLPSSRLAPALADADPPEFCYLGLDGVTCPSDPRPNPPDPQAYAAPPLLNPRMVAEASPSTAGALERFQTRAVDLVEARHGLPDSDREAVLTWGRSEAEAALWGLVVDAISTDKAARTADQQTVVGWMAGRVDGATVSAAQQAGAEYAQWAGLDMHRYRSLAGTGSEAELRQFLAGTPVQFGTVGSAECSKLVCTTKDQTGGYCNYDSPDPYGDEYVGRTNSTCYIPCLAIICLPPAPSFDQLVKWGTAVTTRDLRSPGYELAYAAVSTGMVAGAATLLETMVGVGVILLEAFADLDGYWVGFLGPTLVLMGWVDAAATFTSAASGAAIALAAVLAGIMVSVDFANQSQLPDRLAALVVGARNTRTDPAQLLGSDSGTQTLLGQFVSATSPWPRTDVTCDDSLIPVGEWASAEGTTAIRDPLTGARRTISTYPCLNATPIPGPSVRDRSFSVSRDGAAPARQQSLSMRTPEQPGFTSTVRMAGSWFVQEVSDGTTTVRSQTLGLGYTDWEGGIRYVTMTEQADGTYRFTGLTEKGLSEGVDPASCQADGTCFTTDRLEYLGSDGQKYVASLADPQTLTFGQLRDGTYGQTLLMNATGGASGMPVAYTAGPDSVCSAGADATGSRISLVGVGTCSVTAHQAGDGRAFGPAEPVTRSFTVRPRVLEVSVDRATKVYGAPDPAYTAQVAGLVTGDRARTLAGLTLTGPASGSGVGEYAIVATGVTDPNYQVTYKPAQLEIARARLVVTPDDQTRVVGSGVPTYTATFDGLVNGDVPGDITGLRFSGASRDAPAGRYLIAVGSDKSANYDVVCRQGTETILPAG